MTTTLFYLLLSYWLFAALVLIGFKTKDENLDEDTPKHYLIFIIIISVLFGGVLFPLWIGDHVHNNN